MVCVKCTGDVEISIISFMNIVYNKSFFFDLIVLYKDHNDYRTVHFDIIFLLFRWHIIRLYLQHNIFTDIILFFFCALQVQKFIYFVHLVQQIFTLHLFTTYKVAGSYSHTLLY